MGRASSKCVIYLNFTASLMTTSLLDQALILSQLDYCNILYCGQYNTDTLATTKSARCSCLIIV